MSQWLLLYFLCFDQQNETLGERVGGKRMQESICLARSGRSFIAFSFIAFQIRPPCVDGVFLKTQ